MTPKQARGQLMNEKQRTAAQLEAADDEATWDDLETLVPADEPRFSQQQIAEFNRRLAEYDAGLAQSSPAEDVHRRILAELAKRKAIVA